jgi:phytanoyl-CoA dioxygenase PhyH
MLTAEQKRFFGENGYVKIERLLEESEIAGLRERLEEVLLGTREWPRSCFQTLDPARYRAPSGAPMPEGIQRPAAVDGRFQAVADHPRLVAVMRELIGPDAVRYTDQVILKSPGLSPATFFHQDGFYWRNTSERTINCWIALDDAERDNGCLCFMPGSHRGGLVEHELYFDEPTLHSGETGVPFERKRIPLRWNTPSDARTASDGGPYPSSVPDFAREVAEPARAGDALLFLKYTWHRSDPNRSDRQRRAYAIAYQGKEG